MQSMMIINPSVEVYLLEPDGEIITYVAPYKRVQLGRVELSPVKAFIAADPTNCPLIKGDAPRHPEKSNVFSAAEILDSTGKLEGYAYITRSGEEQASATGPLTIVKKILELHDQSIEIKVVERRGPVLF